MKAGVTLGSLLQRLQPLNLDMLGSLNDVTLLCAQQHNLQQGACPCCIFRQKILLGSLSVTIVLKPMLGRVSFSETGTMLVLNAESG